MEVSISRTGKFMWQKAVARDNMRIPSQFPNILAGCLWHFYFRFLSIEDFCPSSSLKSQKFSQKTKKTEHFGSSFLGYWRWNAWCQRANSIVKVVYRHLFWRPSHCHIPRKIERKKGQTIFTQITTVTVLLLKLVAHFTSIIFTQCSLAFNVI